MTDEYRQDYALLKYAIIAPAVTNMLSEGTTLKEFFEEAAQKTYTCPNGKAQTFHPSTIERWYYAYKNNGGFEALVQKPRIDNGSSRKIDADIEEHIKALKMKSARMPATEILDKLVDDGIIAPNEISLSTVTRCVNRIVAEEKLPVSNEMLRYERPHINEVWCGDSCVGPKVKQDGLKRRLYFLALLDDASRLVPRAMVFHQDNFNSLLQVMKSAVSRYGVPKVWNFDNGGTYKNRQMKLLAARTGSNVHYCHPYTPTQKAKIERWFRTLRDKWLATTDLNQFSTLEEIQASLDRFVDKYNRTVHSALQGKTPEERFFSEPECIRRLSQEDIEKLFLLESERTVSPDCVITIDNVEYEVDACHAKKRIKVRYTPDMKAIYIVEADDSLTPLRLLNKQENARVQRKKVYLSGGDE